MLSVNTWIIDKYKQDNHVEKLWGGTRRQPPKLVFIRASNNDNGE